MFKEFVKRQTTIIVLSVIGLTIATIGVSYAVFMQVDHNTENQVVQSGSLITTYAKGNQITGELMPMTNANGVLQTGYSFTVKNEGTLNASYAIKIHNNIDTGVDTSNYLAHSNLYISFDSGTPVLLNSLTKENPAIVVENNIVYILLNGTINTTETKSHNVKIWLKNDASTDVIGKKVSLVLEVESLVKE